MLDTSFAPSKSWDEFSKPDAPNMHFVFTVCDEAAGEECPLWPGRPLTGHWSVPDPNQGNGACRHRALTAATRIVALKQVNYGPRAPAAPPELTSNCPSPSSRRGRAKPLIARRFRSRSISMIGRGFADQETNPPAEPEMLEMRQPEGRHHPLPMTIRGNWAATRLPRPKLTSDYVFDKPDCCRATAKCVSVSVCAMARSVSISAIKSR